MQSTGLPLQQHGAAYLGQANPFAPAFAQQASQIAAALAQAQAAQAAQAQAAQVSQLLPSHFAPAQLQQPNFSPFAGAQVRSVPPFISLSFTAYPQPTSRGCLHVC